MNISVDLVQVGAFCGVVIAIITAITLIVSPIRKYFKNAEEEHKWFRDEITKIHQLNRLQQKDIIGSKNNAQMGFLSIFALLDLAVKNGANGNVKKTRDALDKYMTDQAFDTTLLHDKKEN